MRTMVCIDQGSLYKWSCFRSQSALVRLKACVRKGYKAMEQVVRRLMEAEMDVIEDQLPDLALPLFKEQHEQGPVYKRFALKQ